MKYTEEEMHELEVLAHLEEKDFDHTTCDNSYIDLVMNAGKKAFEIINKQQNEIERLLKDNYRLDRENQLKFEKALDDLIKSDKENSLLKKQVNLMSKYISNLDIDEDICKKVENNCDDFNKENKCIDCIKQYFESKSKEK